ncbi:MAG: hypothetical protein Q8P67_00370 [archaeon]|nr:hypothetical protein [archaeon]
MSFSSLNLRPAAFPFESFTDDSRLSQPPSSGMLSSHSGASAPPPSSQNFTTSQGASSLSALSSCSVPTSSLVGSPSATIPSATSMTPSPNISPSPSAKLSRKGGRVAGVQNWNSADQQHLLSLLEQHLPFNKSAWRTITEKYNHDYAAAQGRTIRTPHSLEKAFRTLVKSYCKTDSPTERQKRARQISILTKINQSPPESSPASHPTMTALPAPIMAPQPQQLPQPAHHGHHLHHQPMQHHPHHPHSAPHHPPSHQLSMAPPPHSFDHHTLASSTSFDSSTLGRFGKRTLESRDILDLLAERDRVMERRFQLFADRIDALERNMSVQISAAVHAALMDPNHPAKNPFS